MTTFFFLKFLAQIVLPPASLVAGLIAGGLLMLVGVKRLGRWICVLAIAQTVILSLPQVGALLMYSLESEARIEAAAAIPCCYEAIVVLGGAMVPAMPPYYPEPALTGSSDRVWNAARLYHRGIAPRIIVSGGNVRVKLGEEGATSEADAMRRFLTDLGVPSEAIVEEGDSINTIENISFVRKLVKDKPIALVTSAAHMPRALRLARQGGLNASAFPSDWRGPPDAWSALRSWLPSAAAQDNSTLALRELMALAFDRRGEVLKP